MAGAFKYDVFISYSSEDKTVVRLLAQRLNSSGIRVWYDEWALKPGDNWFLKIRQALETSQTVLVCMSPAAFESESVMETIESVLSDDPSNQRRRLIPLLLFDCDIPLRLRAFVYLDYRVRDDAAWEKLRSVLLKRPGPSMSPPEVPDELIQACLSGECLLFAGAGLSAQAGLPIWSGFVAGLLEWADKHDILETEAAQAQRAALREADTNAVADNLVSAFGENKRLLLQYCESLSGSSLALPEAHSSLRRIPFAGMLTTNLDNLLDRTYSDQTLPIYTPRDGEKLLEALSQKSRFLLKLYGTLDQPDSVFVAPADYQAMIASTPPFSRFMEALFFSRKLFFLGASIEGILDYLRGFTFRSTVRSRHFALVGVQGPAWKAKAETLLRRYGIQVLAYDASAGHQEFNQFLQQLADQMPQDGHEIGPQPGSAQSRLRKAILQNIGPFKKLELDFGAGWKALLGDNGVGKSTVLKAIGIAIVGSEAAPYARRVLRVEESIGTEGSSVTETPRRTITLAGTVTLITDRNPNGYVTEIVANDTAAEVISRPSRALEAENWVALGFPPLRTVSWEHASGPQLGGKLRPSAEDVLPLLKGDADPRMDKLKQWIITQDYERKRSLSEGKGEGRGGRILTRFFEIVGELSEGMTVEFVEVTSNYEVKVQTQDGILPIEALSQGMTSLLSWVGILVQRLFEVHDQMDDPTQAYALVLMDEIDAHMHPRWQQTLVGKLKKLFPNVQVVTSTHSPLVVAGMPVSEVVRFVRNDAGEVDLARIDEDMTLGRADQILTGDLFGLDSTLALGEDNERLMMEYQKLLAMSNRTNEQEKRYVDLHSILESRLPAASAETKLQRRTQDLVNTVLTADYSPEKVSLLKKTLLGKTREVAKSMGWKELQ